MFRKVLITGSFEVIKAFELQGIVKSSNLTYVRKRDR